MTAFKKTRAWSAFLAGIFICMALLMAGCAGQPSRGENDFVMGVDAANPPYSFIDDQGEMIGFDVDMAREVARRNGWNLEVRPIEWDAKDALLNSDTIDCIWTAFTMEGREADYTFSEPYMLNKQVLVVRSDSPVVEQSQLAGKVVNTQIDSAAVEALTTKNKELLDSFAELQQIQDYTLGFRNLESGVCDAIACDLTVALYQSAAQPGTFRVLEPGLSDEHLAIGFKKGNVEKAQLVSKTLQEMLKDGAVEDIAARYEQYGLDMKNCCIGQKIETTPVAAGAGVASSHDDNKMSLATLLGILGQGFLITLEIFFVTLLGGLPLGVIVALGRMSSFKPLARFTQICISILRGTPLMLQLLAIFFGPYYLFHMQLTPSWQIAACMIAFIINSTAYFAEIYRSGIQSIPGGQYEAAEVLGYSKQATFMRIILPQVIKRILPAMGNEVITMAKDTSLAFVIGVGELMSASKTTSAAQVSMEPFLWAALLYWLLCLVVEFVLNRTEKKMSYYHD